MGRIDLPDPVRDEDVHGGANRRTSRRELPRSGAMIAGRIFELTTWDKLPHKRKQRWPTPKHFRSGPDFARTNRPKSGGDDLVTAINRVEKGPVNPTWVEWLMGFPLKWTCKKSVSSP